MDFNGLTFITTHYTPVLRRNCHCTGVHVLAINLYVITLCSNIDIACWFGTIIMCSTL